jgi:hypothetical protein
MTGQIRLVVGLVILAQSLINSRIDAAPFSGGIVVERVGGDANFGPGASAPVTGTAVPIFFDEFSLSTGARVQTIALPAIDPDDTGPQRQITENGNAATNGYLSRSANGAYLVTVGYGVPVGTTGLAGNGTVNNRVIARVSSSGAIDTSTWYFDDDLAANNSTPRSVASNDGLSFYVGTANATASTRYVNFGGEDTDTDGIGGGAVRTIALYQNRVFVSVTTTFTSVKDTATDGLPVGPAANNTATAINAITNSNSEQFVMLDLIPEVGVDGTTLDTMYMANANNIDAANAGGLEKYVFDGTNFNLQFTYNAGLATSNTDPLFGGLEGVAFAGFDINGKPIIYATTDAPAAVGNALVRLVDTDSTAAFTLVATAPTNTAFRGVALAPFSAGVPGDYNVDGKVNTADYVLWRKNPGAYGGDPAGYNTWRANFGNPPGNGSSLGDAGTVPEPGTILLAAMGGLGWLATRQRVRGAA